MTAIAWPLAGLLGSVIHVWTVVIAFSAKGLFAAVLSLALPIISQIYWGIWVWDATGTIANPYCLALVGYVLFLVLGILGMAVSGKG